MKWTPFRVVLGVNLLVIAGIYFLPYSHSRGIDIAFSWMIYTFFQIAANLLLVVVAGLIQTFGGKQGNLFASLTKGFLLSAGLTLLISFPLCNAMAQWRT